MKHTYIIILIIIILLLLLVSHKENYITYINSSQRYCKSCDDINITDCGDCVNCGICVNGNSAVCVSGDMDGPLDAKCEKWIYGSSLNNYYDNITYTVPYYYGYYYPLYNDMFYPPYYYDGLYTPHRYNRSYNGTYDRRRYFKNKPINRENRNDKDDKK